MKTTQTEYWRKYLAGSTPCLFPPTTAPKDKREKARKQSVPIDLSRNNDDIRHFCAQNGVYPLNLFQLTWAVVLSRYAASDDVVFAYRENSAFDGSLVVEEESIYRLQFPLEDSFAGLLRHHNSRRYPRHRAFQTGSVPATMGLAGYKGQRLFNTFLYLEPSMEDAEADARQDYSSSTSTYFPHADIAQQYDLVIKVSVGKSHISGSVVYSDSLLSEEVAWQLAETFNDVLATILVDGDERADERDLFQVGSTWGRTTPSRHQDLCVHQVIASQRAEKSAPLAIV